MKRIQTRTALAKSYNVDPRLIKKWLSELGVFHRGALKPSELALFIEKIGDPNYVRKAHDLLLKNL